MKKSGVLSKPASAKKVTPIKLQRNAAILPVMNEHARTEAQRKEYTLVLDLDETLIHFDQRSRIFRQRPYAIQFLSEM